MMAALRIFLFFTLLTGLAYPLAMTGLAQLTLPVLANGSLITKDGKIIGSRLIAQKFELAGHFRSRPSAVDYNPLPSGGSNQGWTSSDLKAKVEERRKAGFTDDLLFASASGLDPHISVEGAKAQAARIALENHLPTQEVERLIDQKTEPRQFGVLGEARVKVLELNRALEERKKATQ